MKCLECNNAILVGKFCSHSCSAKFNNRKRKSPSEDTKRKISEGVKLFLAKNPEKLDEMSNRIRNVAAKRKFEPILVKCQQCGDIFEHNGRRLNRIRKSCSKACSSAIIGLKAANRMGDAKFKPIRGFVSYKAAQNLKVDSLLEHAAIVWLCDEFDVKSIDRFGSILDYYHKSIQRAYNPDFIAVIDGVKTIIEIKYECGKTWFNQDYSDVIPFKKEALDKYCIDNNYKMMWLSPQSDTGLSKLYSRMKGNPTLAKELGFTV